MTAGFATIVKGALAICALYALCYVLGDLAARLSGRAEERPTEKLVSGFAWLLAGFGAAAYPFYVWRDSVTFTPLVWLASGLAAAAALTWLLLRLRRREPRRRADRSFLRDIWFWVCVLLVAEHMLTVLCGYEQCSDDQLYVSISNYAFEQDRVGFVLTIWGGRMAGSSSAASNPFSAWELFVAWIGRLFTLRPVFFYRSFLPLLTMPLCALSAYEAALRLLGSPRRARMCLALYTVLLLFSRGVETVSHGTFLFWMGKAVFYYFLLPRLLCLAADLVKGREDAGLWVETGAALFAGAALSTIGQYSGLLYLFTLGVPYLISLLRRGEKKRCALVLRRTVLCALPVLAVLLFSFFSQYRTLVISPAERAAAAAAETESAEAAEAAAGTGGEADLASTEEEALTASESVDAPEPWRTWLTGLRDRRCSDGVFLWLGVLSIAGFLLLSRDRTRKLLLGWGPVTLLLTFLNPLLARLVSVYVTYVDVYWRLWYLMTFDFTTAAALVLACCSLAERRIPVAEGESAAPPAASEEDELARLERELEESRGRARLSRDGLSGWLCLGAAAAVVAISLLIGPGYRYSGLSTAENLEHSLPACHDMMEVIRAREGGDRYTLLADRIELRSMARQYSSYTTVYIGRWSAFGHWYIWGTYSTYYELEKLVYGDKALGAAAARELLDFLAVDYIVSETPLSADGSGYALVWEGDYSYTTLYLYGRTD